MFMEISKPEYEWLPFLLTTVGTLSHQDPVNRPGGCAFHHFLFVLKGEGRCRVAEGQWQPLKEGTGFLVRQGVPVAYEAVGDLFVTAWLTFRGSGAEALLSYYGVNDCLFFRVPDQLGESLKTLEKSVRRQNISARSAYGYSFVLQLMDQLTQPVPVWSRRVAQVNEYLERCYAEPVTLDDVARAVGCDRFSLCQHYRRITGNTVMTHLRSIRMAQARMLLEQQYSAQDVCSLCGFDSPSYFGKLFRMETGLTPGQYREQCRRGSLLRDMTNRVTIC